MSRKDYQMIARWLSCLQGQMHDQAWEKYCYYIADGSGAGQRQFQPIQVPRSLWGDPSREGRGVNIDPSHLAWCRNTFRLLKNGGCWVVPRSGLIFTRRGQELVLTARMPHDPAMGITAKELADQQLSEYAMNKLHFEAAGIPMKDETP